ncbi:MAG: nitrate reductase molybdenum cofactor assembly chaperone [Magnetovibrio sp.]|nr:nitrate reductase molybdenum cofactor assembly chaperone [Magnetovibrio sp.]
MKSFKAIGAVLNYPSAELISALDEIEACLNEEKTLNKGLSKLLQHMKTTPLLELQEQYVDLFDRTRTLSLHLYEHVHGDSRDRGQSMVDLQSVYHLHGYAMSQPELPDFVPLFCEFLSLAPEKASRSMLGEASTVLEVIRTGLDKRDSLYEAAIVALINLGGAKINYAELEKILKAQPEDETSLESIDAAWEEAPVTFGPESAPQDACQMPTRARGE